MIDVHLARGISIATGVSVETGQASRDAGNSTMAILPARMQEPAFERTLERPIGGNSRITLESSAISQHAMSSRDVTVSKSGSIHDINVKTLKMLQ